MKVVHVPFCFPPDVVGGTEVYVDALAREQQRRGIEVVVAAPADESHQYDYNGLHVRRFGKSLEFADTRVLYGAGDDVASRAFQEVLVREQPDVVHLHAYTSAISLQLAREVKRHGCGLVFTYHTPTATCARGTLLRWDGKVCDGALDLRRCARCVLETLGAPAPAAFLIGSLPQRVGERLANAGRAGGVWTALRMTELVALQQASMRAFLAEADRVVVLCEWASRVLVLNGVPTEKIAMSRHGLSGNQDAEIRSTRGRSQSALRVAFMGRLHPTKGVDVLVRALRTLPDASIQLDVFGLIQDDKDEYARRLGELAASDARIRFQAPLESSEVVDGLRGYDVLAVPSQWLETGPLVVLEAFAAGIPVVGSRLGGIAELVEDGVDGLLVTPDSVEEWANALVRL
ncbi:MAG: glycosyltransferase, partial [Chloroflexi bacterium]|nr:glycosyltransferase [Chloroflexota bacterium]